MKKILSIVAIGPVDRIFLPFFLPYKIPDITFLWHDL